MTSFMVTMGTRAVISWYSRYMWNTVVYPSSSSTTYRCVLYCLRLLPSAEWKMKRVKDMKKCSYKKHKERKKRKKNKITFHVRYAWYKFVLWTLCIYFTYFFYPFFFFYASKHRATKIRSVWIHNVPIILFFKQDGRQFFPYANNNKQIPANFLHSAGIKGGINSVGFVILECDLKWIYLNSSVSDSKFFPSCKVNRTIFRCR